MLAAVLAFAALAPEDAPATYVAWFALSDGGRVYARPVMEARAGEPARIVVEGDRGYALNLVLEERGARVLAAVELRRPDGEALAPDAAGWPVVASPRVLTALGERASLRLNPDGAEEVGVELLIERAAN